MVIYVASDEIAEYLKGILAVHNSGELPLTLGTVDQNRKLLQYIGEWRGAESAKVNGKISDNVEELADMGYTLNEKEQAEDGAFVDIYGLIAPSGLLYLAKPLARLFDDARDLGSTGPSEDVKALLSMPLSEYSKQTEDRKLARFLAETQRIDRMAQRYKARTELLQAAAVQP